jgi:hypothetical protein
MVRAAAAAAAAAAVVNYVIVIKEKPDSIFWVENTGYIDASNSGRNAVASHKRNYSIMKGTLLYTC